MKILSKGDEIQAIQIRRPSNFHAHLRRGPLMQAIAPHLMRYPKYLLIMPNTGPIRTMAQAIEYHDELMEIADRASLHHRPKLLMTLYHTADLTPATIEEIAMSSIVYAIKHYPPVVGATTGSGHGIPLEASDELFAAMADMSVPLLGHFESVVDKDNRPLDPLDGEAYMVEHHLGRLRDRHPNLRICFEHISTKEGIRWVKDDTSGNTAATITPHHPNFNINDFRKYKEDLKCKPSVQTPENQGATNEFMTSGDPRAIAGDDTAAHPSKTKRVGFVKAANGCYLAEQAIPLYAKAFDKANALGKPFEQFMSLNGPAWWELPPPSASDVITIARGDDKMPEPVEILGEDDVVIPLGWEDDPAKRLHTGFVVQD